MREPETIKEIYKNGSQEPGLIHRELELVKKGPDLQHCIEYSTGRVTSIFNKTLKGNIMLSLFTIIKSKSYNIFYLYT